METRFYRPNEMQMRTAVQPADRFRSQLRFRDKYPALTFLGLLTLLLLCAAGIVVVLR